MDQPALIGPLGVRGLALSLSIADWKIIGGYDSTVLQRIRDENDGGLYVSGSGTLVRQLLAEGLVVCVPVDSGPRSSPLRRERKARQLVACELRAIREWCPLLELPLVASNECPKVSPTTHGQWDTLAVLGTTLPCCPTVSRGDLRTPTAEIFGSNGPLCGVSLDQAEAWARSQSRICHSLPEDPTAPLPPTSPRGRDPHDRKQVRDGSNRLEPTAPLEDVIQSR